MFSVLVSHCSEIFNSLSFFWFIAQLHSDGLLWFHLTIAQSIFLYFLSFWRKGKSEMILLPLERVPAHLMVVSLTGKNICAYGDHLHLFVKRGSIMWKSPPR